MVRGRERPTPRPTRARSNPIVQSERFDPEGRFIVRWVPEVRELIGPARHFPPRATPLELEAAGNWCWGRTIHGLWWTLERHVPEGCGLTRTSPPYD